MHGSVNVILYLLVQIALILVVSRVMGILFARFNQPQVMGEMVAGIMLGPSLLGWLAPGASAAIFTPETVPYLGVLSQLGVIFFLFLIGLELDPTLIRNRGHAAVVISHVSIIAPFLLGGALTIYLYPRVFNDAPHMNFTSASLFIGAAMSITAFPVLARILTERNLHKTKVGAVTITCAAVDDVSAWCLLAFVVAIARADGLRPALITAGASGVYVLVMFFLVRPFLGRLQAYYDRQGRLSQDVVAIIFLLTLVSAYTTEVIGIHALFGAFLMGAIMPKGTRFVRSLSEKLEDYTVVLLLPIFFAYTGLKTRIGLLNNGELWLDTVLVIAVACLGKFGGSTLAARACGIEWRESSAIGILMNTRGLMELVILNIGRELGVITDAVFAMMVIMALVTTALTTPILSIVYPRRLFEAAPTPEEKARPAPKYSILIPVAHPRSGGPLLRLATMIAGPTTAGGDASRIYALHLRRPVEHEAYRSGLDEAETHAEPLESVLSEMQETPKAAAGPAVQPISFVSRDVPADIARVAGAWHVDLVLMGFHNPVLSKAILGGTVHRVMTTAPADVGVLVDRGFETAAKILVPFLGSAHDRFAMELASRLARNAGGAVTVLHVVPPGRGKDARVLGAKDAVDRVFHDPTQPKPVTFRVIEDASPVDAVLRESPQFDLVVIGVAEEWGLETHLFGWRPERVARESPTSLLIVRKHEGPRPPLTTTLATATSAS